MRSSFRDATWFFGAVVALAVAGLAHAFPTDAQVREMLRRRVEAGLSSGIVVGMVDPGGSRIVAYGRDRPGGDGLADGDTVFEVGSITKVFTSLLLAQMAGTGEVGLDDPIAKYVPPWVKSPRTREVTLLQLSRHTAGFPPWPDNMKGGVYTNEMLFAFLDAHRTTRQAGSFQLYSNYGVALLGELLARRAGTDFETALRRRVLEPLGMSRTGIAFTGGMPAAGSLRSTGNDMVRFLEASLGLRESPLAAAIRTGLGWSHESYLGTRLAEHGGATIEAQAYMALDPERRRGVVILSNGEEGIRNIGIHLLVPLVPLYLPDLPEK